ncbi:MAG: hypothetical protein AB7V27_03720 [Candidatus Binatia bacterium]
MPARRALPASSPGPRVELFQLIDTVLPEHTCVASASASRRSWSLQVFQPLARLPRIGQVCSQAQ